MKDNAFIKKTLDFSKSLDIDLVKKVIVFDKTPSTNSKAKELAGKQEGTVVIARVQKKGKGRLDRVWESPEGGVYLSIILRPDCALDKTTLISLTAAITVSKTISSYGASARVKWPNDVLIGRKKIAGILLESEVHENRVEYVVLGIGINLNTDLNLLSEEIRLTSTSLSKEIGTSVDYHNFIKKLLLNLDEYYKLFLNKKYDYIIKEWKNQSDTIGRKVEIITPSEQIRGRVSNVDQSGFLIVIGESGERKKVVSGDCIYIEN